jgi:hypothetical protein
LKPCRIFEIGDRALFARVHPDTTRLAWTGRPRALPPGLAGAALDARSSTALAAAVRAGSFDAVVWHVPEVDPWREPAFGLGRPHVWRAWRFARESRSWPMWRSIVVDTRDRATMTRSVASSLARADAYFLRECPADLGAWLGRANLRHASKVAPMSIGLSHERLAELPSAPVEKSIDVFFAGQADTPLRRAGLPVLRDLARAGVRVEIALAPLPRAEFYRRCASAWIVWSPEGRGWQCFRHLESAVCGSVPLINRPAIRQHEPLIDGVHGLHYDPAPGALAAAILAALADKGRLARIAGAGRAHVLRHHTHAAMCDRILAAIYEPMPK